MPWVLVTPLLVALAIILGHAIRLLIPYRPVWSRPFVQEPEYKHEGLKPAFRKCMSIQNSVLLLLSFCGLALQIIPLLRAPFQLQYAYVALTWVSSLPESRIGHMQTSFSIMLDQKLQIYQDSTHILDRFLLCFLWRCYAPQLHQNPYFCSTVLFFRLKPSMSLSHPKAEFQFCS